VIDAEADDAVADALLEEGEDVQEGGRVGAARAGAEDGVAAVKEALVFEGPLGELEERGRVRAARALGEVALGHTSSKALQNVTSARPSRSAFT